ncbi:MAG: hypothetical protein ACRC8A_07440 [Microcoleaceae cyanobacterium]
MEVDLYILVDSSAILTKVEVFLIQTEAIAEKNRRPSPSKVEIFKRKIVVPV